MKAFHSCWTKPFFVRGGKAYYLDDFELLSAILSALVWRKNGGSIKMLTDAAGAEYFYSRKMDWLWDDGIEAPLDGVPDDIDPFLFWAGGKLWALKSCTEPTCMIDTDMIVWHDPSALLADKEIAVAHREEIAADVYPPKEYFRMKEGYAFSERGWDALPCNTAFLYIKDMDFKNYYIARSMDFMRSLSEDTNVVIPMVFAEQRMLAICAEERGKPIYSMLDRFHLTEQSEITHIWGHKAALRADKAVRAEFCRRCINRIRRDFPEYADMLRHIPEITGHLWSMD